jgi:hypothetical protein
MKSLFAVSLILLSSAGLWAGESGPPVMLGKALDLSYAEWHEVTLSQYMKKLLMKDDPSRFVSPRLDVLLGETEARHQSSGP